MSIFNRGFVGLMIYIIIISCNLLMLKCCEDFKISNTQSILNGYELLSIKQLNDPAIKAQLIHQYNQQQGISVGISWTPGINCLVTSIANDDNGLSVNNETIYLFFGNSALFTASLTANDIHRIGTVGERKFLYDFGEFTSARCVLDNNPGIFGKNCDINNKVILTKPGIYKYQYTSNEEWIDPNDKGNHAKYHIEFTISNFTCYNPTLTVKTSNQDYDLGDENLVVTYIFGNESDSMAQIISCNGRSGDPFCLANAKPGDTCGILGSGVIALCDRDYSCPQYYTPTNEWVNGNSYGFVISNGIEVNNLFCRWAMNIEVTLSCATKSQIVGCNNKEYVTNSYTSTENNAEYLISYLMEIECFNPRITLRTQTSGYDNSNGKYISLYYDSANPTLIGRCGYNNSNFCNVNNGSICNDNIGQTNTCYLSASCFYEYTMPTFPVESYQLFRIVNGPNVASQQSCENTMQISITLACRDAVTPLFFTNEPTLTPTIYPTINPSLTPSKTPTNSPTTQTELPTIITITPSDLPTTMPTLTPTAIPTNAPTNVPTKETIVPTEIPTKSPTIPPTDTSNQPSRTPTGIPTRIPTKSPTKVPSKTPTVKPSKSPTQSPLITSNNNGISNDNMASNSNSFQRLTNGALTALISISITCGLCCCLFSIIFSLYIGYKNNKTKNELNRMMSQKNNGLQGESQNDLQSMHSINKINELLSEVKILKNSLQTPGLNTDLNTNDAIE